MIRYYDAIEGRYRFKRRYVWAACAFALGAVCGALLAQLR